MITSKGMCRTYGRHRDFACFLPPVDKTLKHNYWVSTMQLETWWRLFTLLLFLRSYSSTGLPWHPDGECFHPICLFSPCLSCLLGSRGALLAHCMGNVLHLSTAPALFPVVNANKPVGLFGCEQWLPFSVWDLGLVNCLDRTDWLLLKEAHLLDLHLMAAGSTMC